MLGLLTYDTPNLGDDIQSVAIRDIIPAEMPTHPVMRDYLGPYKGPRMSMVLNGWWLHHTHNWPPSPLIRPLLTSFHVTKDAQGVILDRNRDYLIRHGPVGCRDVHTLDAMRSRNIPCHLSLCATATLRPRNGPRSGVVWCDVGPYNRFPDSQWQQQAKETMVDDMPVTTHTHCLQGTLPAQERMDMARRSLDLLASAEYVITSRLHVAMPCLAMGTDVILVIDHGSNLHRFVGMMEHMNVVTGIQRLWPADMPPNPDTSWMAAYADAIRDQVLDFVTTDPT